MTDGDDAPLLRQHCGSRYIARAPGAPLLPALPAPMLDGFTAEAKALAAQAWTLRAEEEHRSAAIFAELSATLVMLGWALDLTGLVVGTVADELRHAALCTELALRFAAPPPRARTERVATPDGAARSARAGAVDPARRRRDGRDPLQRVIQ